MKQKDIVIIAAIALVAAVFAVVASKLVIRADDKKQSAEVVQAISPDFQTPDPRFFNSSSIDPTLQIQIGENANADPFRNSSAQ